MMKTSVISDVDKKLREIEDEIIRKCKNDIIHNSNPSCALMAGEGGMLLFLAYASRYRGEKKLDNIFEDYLEWYLERITSSYMQSLTYCSGMSGILFLLKFLHKEEFINIDVSELENSYHHLFLNELYKGYTNHHYDYLHGVIGVGINYLEREDGEAVKVLNNILNFLDKISIKEGNQFKWIDIHKKLPNLSLSHGMSSIVIFLCKLYEQDIENREKIKKLLIGAINYILAQEIDYKKYGFFFPSFSLESFNPSHFSRLSWCYGDLGVAFALFYAGKVLENSTYMSKSIQILDYSNTRLQVKEKGIMEGGICHGTAGVAQIFKRCFYITGDKKYLFTNEFWIKETLKMAEHTDGYCGYKYYHGEEGWQKGHDMLLGISGIGLAFLSFINNEEDFSKWDKILFLS